MSHAGTPDDPESAAAALRLIAETLGGGARPYPADRPPEFAELIVRTARMHGVHALLSETLRRSAPHTWPDAVTGVLQRQARAQALHELVIELELKDLLSLLARRHIDALLFKGTPIAYSLYAKPHLRLRCDTDLLVPLALRESAHQVLIEAGYQTSPLPPNGELVFNTHGYVKPVRLGVLHRVDLHWRLSNSPLYARTFSFGELMSRAAPVAALGASARMPGPAHALIIACMHRTSHLAESRLVEGLPYREADRLIWLFDIHLLAGQFAPSDWSEFLEVARAKRLRAVCADGLAASRSHFGTAIPSEILAGLDAPGHGELSKSYLSSNLLHRHWAEVRAVPGWVQRVRFVIQRLFPPRASMPGAHGHGSHNRLRLPGMYLRRLIDHFRQDRR